MKKIAVIASAMLMLRGVGLSEAQETKPIAVVERQTVKKQTICPVMGGQVNTNLYVDAHGKRIYVCCKMCVDEVKKDPAKYIKKLEAEGITLDKTPQAATTNAPAPSLQRQEERKRGESSGHHQ